MAVGTRRYTVQEFEQFVEQPGNADRLFEYIGGEIVEVPSNPYGSQIASLIGAELMLLLKGKNLGHVTGEAGGYMVSGERYAPDVAFISKARQPRLAERGYNPNPPELAVEVLSPPDQPGGMRIKLTNYLAAGTTVWIVEPESRVVEVHAPGQRAQKIGIDGTLDGGEVLPGFKLAVKTFSPIDPALPRFQRRDLIADRARIDAPGLAQDHVAAAIKQQQSRHRFHPVQLRGAAAHAAQHIQAQHGGAPYQILFDTVHDGFV